MLLAIDIGNTSIHNGIFEGRALKKAFRVPSDSGGLKRLYHGKIRPYLNKIDRVMIVSVAPAALKKTEKALTALLGRRIEVVGRDVDSGVRNLYRRPGQVGQDRLVNARAAHDLYGGACVIVDFGTAVTIDIVNRKKEYLGGAIAAGAEISLWALSERTALLPKTAIRRPKGILGKETSESMVIGAVRGLSSLCDGLAAQMKKRCCKGATRVVATGGLSALIGRYCENIDKIDPLLTLKGLRLISEDRHV
ncbi:MAG: type III pantothenate kinase [Candidatus Omnitrophota bacterium]